MNLKDLAAITGKSIEELRCMLNEQDCLEVNLSERKQRDTKEELLIM